MVDKTDRFSVSPTSDPKGTPECGKCQNTGRLLVQTHGEIFCDCSKGMHARSIQRGLLEYYSRIPEAVF